MAKKRKTLTKIKVLKTKTKGIVAQTIENQPSKPRKTRKVAQETMEVKELNTISNSIIEILTPPKE